MKVFRLDESESFFPQVVPLVDIILLVLIFFLVTATYTSIPQALDVNLPETNVSDGPAGTKSRLFISSTGRVRLQGNWVDEEKLLERLKNLRRSVEEPVLLITADARSRHQRLVDVLAAARRAGIENLGFEITLREQNTDG